MVRSHEISSRRAFSLLFSSNMEKTPDSKTRDARASASRHWSRRGSPRVPDGVRAKSREGASRSLAFPSRPPRASRFPPGGLARRASPARSQRRARRSRGRRSSRAPVAAMDSRDGIQKLLAAEQEAQAIVTAARAEKTSRLRQAKAEADAEIAAYRAQREEKYQSLLSSRVGDSSARAARLETDAAAAIERVQAQVNAGKKAVTDMLAAKVTSA
jgi:V-type H+-transporting ATPase subunit G